MIKKTHNSKAVAAYEQAHNRSNALAYKISELLFDQPCPEVSDIDWSNVGSMVEVQSRLQSIVDFLEGNEQ